LATCTRKCVDCLNIEQEVNVPEGEWTYAPDDRKTRIYICMSSIRYTCESRILSI